MRRHRAGEIKEKGSLRRNHGIGFKGEDSIRMDQAGGILEELEGGIREVPGASGPGWLVWLAGDSTPRWLRQSSGGTNFARSWELGMTVKTPTTKSCLGNFRANPTGLAAIPEMTCVPMDPT